MLKAVIVVLLKYSTGNVMKDIMSEINSYGTALSLRDNDLSQKKHRQVVGGLWEELGTLQFEFLISQGLQPEHKFLDLGCGCLRGGVKFINYLNKGNYIGIDINESLLKAGKLEIKENSLSEKCPLLLRSDSFGSELEVMDVDFAISVSLFTHLPISYIQEALLSVKSMLNDKGTYFATFFVAESINQQFSPIKHNPGSITTYAHKDPFHFNVENIKFISQQVGLECSYIGNWEHPRNQKMFKFEHM
jgi:cyclopropane fatty-acyl-phospholipid synthase-like methyltransferase